MGSEFCFFKIIPNFYGAPFENILQWKENVNLFIGHKMLKFQPCGWHIKKGYLSILSSFSMNHNEFAADLFLETILKCILIFLFI